MQLFLGQISTIRSKYDSSRVKLLGRIAVQAVLLAGAVAVSLACYSSRTEGVLTPINELELPTLDLAGIYDGGQTGIGGQVLGSDRSDGVRINADAFNSRRKQLISKDSEELLSLALALKGELNRNPGESPAADAVQKAQEIEKLARKVKEQMRFNPPMGPL